MSRLPGRVLVAALVTALAVPVRAQVADTSTVKWSVIRIAGAPVGWRRSVTRPIAEGSRAESRMFLALNRMGSQVVMETNVVALENADGRLREVDLTTKMSEQSTTTHVAFGAAKAVMTTRAGGRSFDRTIPVDGELLGAEGVRRATLVSLRVVGDSIQYREWDGQMNAVSTVTRRLLELAPVRRGSAMVLALLGAVRFAHARTRRQTRQYVAMRESRIAPPR